MSASIFIVEDEALIRMMLVEMIEDLGHKVIGEAGRIDEGRSLADTLEYDLAILDINLQGFNVQPIAEAVRRRGRPLFFLSGYGSDGAPIGFEGTPILNKPCTPDRLKRMIDAVVSNQGFSEVLQGVPRSADVTARCVVQLGALPSTSSVR